MPLQVAIYRRSLASSTCSYSRGRRQEKAKEAEAPAYGRAAARPPRVMYEQVKFRL